MSIAVELPALGESVVEGTVSRWLVKEGDRVERDQPIVEITTDKVDAEIPAPAAGVIEALLVAEGDVVEVGAELARIDTEGAGDAKPRPEPSAEGEERQEPEAPREQREAAPAAREAPEARRDRQDRQDRQQTDEAPAQRGEAPSPTPLARRKAESGGVDLEQVQGSGARGRVTAADVERASQPARSAPAPARAPQRRAPAPERPSAPPRESRESRDSGRPAYMDYQLQPGDEVIPMTPLRRLVAEHMVLSKRVSPHVGTVAEIDMAGVVKVRNAHKRAFQEANGFGLSFLPFIVHAAVRALREYPRLNASVIDDAIVEKKDIHMGIAVETEKGLVVPVVRHADRLSLAGLAQAVEDLASRARSKKLSPDELKGGTFTLSNPGRQGNLYGFAIINQPQVGILRMGEIVKRPVVRSIDGEDAIVIRPMMHLALSYDHRAVDGAPANGFLFRIRELLEEAEFDL
jgi:2-oxoglutarate dehydrogenase E2 component (dihydrolipoamide succinyltransferase)